MIRCSVSSSPASMGADRPVVQHDARDRRGSTSSLDVGRVEEDRDALRAQLAHQLVDLGLGADVDAARRVVHEQQQRLLREHPAEQHLLLVAARERSRLLQRAAQDDLEPLDHVVDEAALLLRAAVTPHVETRFRLPSEMLSRMREREAEALRRAVLRDQHDAGAERVLRLAQTHLAAVHDDAPGRATGAEQRQEQLVLTLSLEPADAHDLAAPDRQADVVESGRRREVGDLADDAWLGVELVVPLGVDAVDLAPEHQLDETRLGHLADRAAADVDAAAEDGDPVAEVLDLLEAVRDEDGDPAAFRELAHLREEPARPARAGAPRSARRARAREACGSAPC